MKRTRKTRRTFTDAQKRGLVNEVITLLNQGIKLTYARIEVARKNNTTPISLARWSKDKTIMATPKTNTIVNPMTPYRKLGDEQLIHTANNVSTVHVTGVDLHVPGKGIVKLDHQLLTHISKLAGYTG